MNKNVHATPVCVQVDDVSAVDLFKVFVFVVILEDVCDSQL